MRSKRTKDIDIYIPMIRAVNSLIKSDDVVDRVHKSFPGYKVTKYLPNSLLKLLDGLV